MKRMSWVLGIIIGLYLSRVIAESAAGIWHLWMLLLLCLCSILLGLVFSALLGKLSLRAWPLSLLLAYGLWPWAWPLLAWATLLVALVMLLMLNMPRPCSGPWMEGGVLLGALALYISTLSPSVLPADSGEFQLVGAVLGIAHPPGYPLYTMFGKLFTFLPFGDAAYRMNLFAAVCSALTLVILAHSVRRATGSAAAALVAAGMLGLGTTYWAQSTTANIRSLTALFTALCITMLLLWGEVQDPRYLLAFAASFGLGMGHHSSIGLLGLPFLAYILARSPRIVLQPGRWLLPLGAFLASFLVLLYLPVRSMMGAPFDPAPIRSWAGFVNHVLALGFRGDLFYFRTWPELSARLSIWLEIMRLQFGPLLPLAALLAIYPMARNHRCSLLLLAGVWAVNTVAALTYRAPQTVEYLIPSYVALAMIMGCGLGLVLRRPYRAARPYRTAWPTLPQPLAAGLAALLALGVSLNGATSYPSLRALHHDTSVRADTEEILRDAPPNTLILSNWHYATVFWYLQQVEGVRPDIEVRYVYPEGALPNEEVWLRRIASDVDGRPVVVTNRFMAFERTDYRWIPIHRAWLVRREPLTVSPVGVVPKEALYEGGIRVLGYELDGDTLAPGGTLSLRIYWQAATPLQRDYSTFAQLLGPQGVVGQGDIVQRSREVLPGEVRVDAYRFPLLLHTAPGDYQLITGFYYGVEGGWKRLLTQGQDHLLLTTVQVRAPEIPAATLHPQEQHYAAGLRLTGIDYDRTVPGQTRLYLHWWQPRVWYDTLAPGAVSVRLSAGGGVIAQTELPALQPGSAATVALDVPDTQGRVSLSLTGPGGRPVARLGPWHRPIAVELELLLPHTEVHYVPLGGEMAFVGLQHPPQAAYGGRTLWLRPRFLALGALLRDYTVSVGLARRDPFWEQKADGTPALGAIPTLKWVRGWLVEDPHPLPLATGTPAGPAAVTLSVYDAFTLEPLGVLDERLVRQGQGTYLEWGSLEIR